MPVEIGSRYTDGDWSQKLMTLSDFIDNHILCEVYIILCRYSLIISMLLILYLCV